MKLKNLVLSSLIAAITMPIAAYADWIHYQGNAGHTGFVNVHTNPAYYRVLWQRKLGDAQNNVFQPEFIIVKNMAFYLIDEFTSSVPSPNYEVGHRLMAIDTNTGETVWSVNLPKNVGYRELKYVNGKLLVIWGSYQGRHIFAYEPKTGKHLYSSRIPNNIKLTETGNNKLYFVEESKHTTNIGTINPENGWPNWVVNDGGKDEIIGLGVAKNNLITVNRYAGKSDSTIAIRDTNTGAVTSTISIDLNEFGRLDTSIPVIDDVTHAAYFKASSKRAYFLAYDLSNTAKEKWKIKMSNWSVSTPVVAGNEIYISQADEDYRSTVNVYDTNSGKLLWSWSNDDDVEYKHYQPVATIDTLFVPTEKATYAISRINHQVVWKLPESGKLAIVDNKLIITSGDYVTVVALNK